MILNLDNNYTPLGAEQALAFRSFTFNGGEPHIVISTPLDNVRRVTITHRVHSFNDMGLLLLAVDALRRAGVEELELYLPYFPGARQDRVMQQGEPLTVKVYANLINQCNFKKVVVFDPHSEVVAALVNNIAVVNNHHFVAQVAAQIQDDFVLVSPDGGALKKIYGVAAHLGGVEVVECSKKRDVKTGQLSGFRVYNDNSLAGKNCLIVDDICDGGGTFLGLAKALKAKGVNKIYLAVSHGIFSKGIAALNNAFEQIFTTDSFEHQQDVQVIDY